MKVDKKIKELPWPEPWSGNPQQHFYITLAWPVVNHERILVLTFLQNRGEKGGNTRRDFRLICSKKQMAISVLYKGERQGRRHELYRACGISPRWAYPEISPKAEETLAKWLGKSESGNHFLPELEQWVNRAICAELQRERDARGEIRDEAVNLCPEPLPDGLERYIRLQVLPNDRVLLYKKGNVRGKCYCCGRDVKARHQRFKQNELVRCPECGEIVTCYLKDSDRFKVDYVQNIASIQKGTDGETVFIRQWHLKRDPEAKWKDIPAFLEEICRYAIRGNHVAKWQCEAKETWYYSSYRYATSGWKRMQNHSEVYDGSYYFYCPDNWEEVFSDTSLQYCPLPEYMNDPEDTKNFRNVIRYLMDWAKYPMIEKFWKAGYTKLVHEHVSGLRKDERHLIRWNRDSFREALKFPTRLLKIYPPEEWKMWRIKKTENAWNAAVSGRILEKDIPEMVRSEAELAHISDAIGGTAEELDTAQMKEIFSGVVSSESMANAEEYSFGTSGDSENAILSGGAMYQSPLDYRRYGLRFTPAVAFEIIAIRVWISGWTNPNRKVVLHDNDNNVLFSVEDTSGVSGWNQIDLSTPITVSPDKTYTLYQNTYYYSGYNNNFGGTVFNSKLGVVVGTYGAKSDTGTPNVSTTECGSVDFVIAPTATVAPDEYKIQRNTMDAIANEVKRITGATTELTTAQIVTALQGVASTA